MSYAQVTPEYYRMLQPDSAWHAGSPGWSRAPVPGWGMNPNRVGPPRLAVNGVTMGRRRGMGDVANPMAVMTQFNETSVPLTDLVRCPSGEPMALPVANQDGSMSFRVTCSSGSGAAATTQKPSPKGHTERLVIGLVAGVAVALLAQALIK
jgi:hypothetical protein